MWREQRVHRPEVGVLSTVKEQQASQGGWRVSFEAGSGGCLERMELCLSGDPYGTLRTGLEVRRGPWRVLAEG